MDGSRFRARPSFPRRLETGAKTVFLNAPALEVLQALPRRGSYVIPGDKPDAPRADLKRLWEGETARADLRGVRIHDLRHTFASVGAGASLGLPIVGKLLGHSQSSTTQRYAHLDADPLRRAADTIGATIAAAMDGRAGATITLIKKGRGRRSTRRQRGLTPSSRKRRSARRMARRSPCQ